MSPMLTDALTGAAVALLGLLTVWAGVVSRRITGVRADARSARDSASTAARAASSWNGTTGPDLVGEIRSLRDDIQRIRDDQIQGRREMSTLRTELAQDHDSTTRHIEDVRALLAHHMSQPHPV